MVPSWFVIAALTTHSLTGAPASIQQAVAKNSARVAVLDPRLRLARGQVEVVVQLDDLPLAAIHARDAKGSRSWFSPAQQRQHLGTLKARHDALATIAHGLGGTELARLSKALNAVVLRIDAGRLNELAETPNIVSIRPVMQYQLNLAETVPYIGAAAVQAAGFDGSGVRVAVLDSGVDYTHKNLGGPGTLDAYTAAYGTNDLDPRNTMREGLFPTAKVIGGYDFVGEAWPDGPLAPDPDPIDANGHGTHVADIIAGKSLDGTHKGTAPGAKIFAIKVCSTAATACSGVALLEAMDLALDPNGDGDLSDAVDVINMSLGSSYGQKEDDLSAASANAVHLGVVVVAAAGNDGDKPYVISSPGSTPEVIAVAQTQVPSAKRYPLVINSPTNVAGEYRNTETVGWAPIGAGFTGDVVFVGRGCPGDTYLADPSGKVALINRGSCSVSLKVDRAAKAGAIGVLIAMVDGSDPISFSYGGGDTFVPTLVITKSVADLIRANIGAPVNVTVSPANAISLVGGMVGSSARGPSYSYNAIKPDIGAPGASVSAEVGTGDGETSFGGTSGATPMISGSAALLLQAFPNRSPMEIKSLLMNSAETAIQTDPSRAPGVLAPITRIGGGEVRVDRALKSRTAAWSVDDPGGSLSFGYHAMSDPQTLVKQVVVHNYSNKPRTYSISSQFRYGNDAASQAVKVLAPSSVRVPGRGAVQFPVQLSVTPSKLPDWNLNGGDLGGAGPLLQGVEYDGYLRIQDESDDIHVAWQVLPHKAAAVSATFKSGIKRRGGTLVLDNTRGATDGGVEIFSLTGQNPQIRKKFLPGPGDNFALIDLHSVGVRAIDLGGEPGVQFAVNTFGARSHPNYPGLFDVLIDTNGDGQPEFEVFNQELGGFAATGQNVVYVLDDTDPDAVPIPVFFSDVDLNSPNLILTVPLSMVGLTESAQFQFSVYAIDDYFTGNVTDAITDMKYTLGSPAFEVTGGGTSFAVPAGAKGGVAITGTAAGGDASPSQSGLLLLYRDAQAQLEAEAIILRGQ